MGNTVIESQGVIATSVPQSDYNTGVTPSTTPNFRQIVASQFVVPPDYNSPNVSNQGQATGSAYGTKTSKGRADASGSFDIYLTFQELGFWAFRSFGVYDTPTLVTTGVYSHHFSLFNPQTNRQLAAWMLAAKLSEPALSANKVYDYKFRGCKVNSFGVSTPHSEEQPFLMASVGWNGSGKREAGDVKFFGSGKHVLGTGAGELDEPKIPENGKMALFGDVSYADPEYATGCDFYDFKATINENLNLAIGYSGCAKFQDDADAGSAQIRGDLPVTEQTVELEFTMKLTPELRQNFDFEALREAGTEISAQWEFDGPAIASTYIHKAIFGLASFRIGQIEYPTIDGVRGIRIVTQPQAISSVMPFDLTLISPVANFATFVG